MYTSTQRNIHDSLHLGVYETFVVVYDNFAQSKGLKKKETDYGTVALLCSERFCMTSGTDHTTEKIYKP